jgi:hypothetical protein
MLRDLQEKSNIHSVEKLITIEHQVLNYGKIRNIAFSTLEFGRYKT